MAQILTKQDNQVKSADSTPFLDKIKAKEKSLAALYTRMDLDRDIVYLNKYQLKDSKGKAIPNTISVTMNDPAVFASAIVATLMTSNWQTIVQSKNKKFKTSKIEQFLGDVEADANARLVDKGEPTLFEWICSHICVRSYIGCRFLYLYDDNGELYPDYMPVDMRYTPYDYGTTGLAWVAPKFYMTAAEIAARYPDADYDDSGDSIEVIDAWDREKNELYIAGKLIYSNPHSIGYPPFAISRPATGFMLRDKDYMKHEAESIFQLNRDLYDEWNRVVSIGQTVNQKLIQPAYQKTTADLSGESASYPDGIGKVTEHLPNEPYELLQTKDINQAHQESYNTFSSGLQRGGINNIDLGNVGQSVSAVWITEQAEIRSKLLEPRLKCLANFRSSLSRMAIDQYVKGEYKTDLGSSGMKTNYSVSDLGDPKTYTVSYNLRSKSKKMEIANLAMAQGARGILPEKVIITDILDADDPEGIIEQLDYEKAEASDPVLFFFRKAFSIAVKALDATGDEADKLNLESMRLTTKGLTLAKAEQMQAQQGAVEPSQGKTNATLPDSNTLVPMLGQPLGNGTGLSGISPNGGK